MTETLLFTISSFEEGSSLLAFVKIQCALTNRLARRLVEKGFCKINGVIELFTSRKLQEKDCVEISPLWKGLLQETQGALQILYEDDFLILIEKPSGLVCEDKNLPASFPAQSTFVHRLDLGTSGIMMVAKSKEIKEKMVAQFLSKNVKKFYFAILDGIVAENNGRIESYLSRRSQKMTLFGSMQTGKHALTLFRVVKRIKKATLVLCQPVTGRTHQLRVHFFERGHPILGDYVYAKKFSYPSHVERLLLHSARLEFFHPFLKKKMVFDSPLPELFSQVMGGVGEKQCFSLS